ncbi:MAG: CHAT domain-containing protein, partial [Lewinella sp.]|nr:CHAT domain-containing protein [Lewinella sp.]
MNTPEKATPACLWACLVVFCLLPVMPAVAQHDTTDSLRLESYYARLGQYCYTNLDSTIFYLDLLLEDTKRLGWTQEQAYAYLWGILCTGYQDQIDLKYDLLEDAGELMKQKGMELPVEIRKGVDRDLQMHWGDYYMETGGYNHALDIYEALIADLESQKELSDEEFERLVICNQYLAAIHRQLGSFKEAIDYYFRALNYERQYYARKGESAGEQTLVYSRIANAYWLMGERSKAMGYYGSAFEKGLRKYLAAPEENRRVRKRLISLGLELGGHYRELGKTDSALLIIQQIEPITDPAEAIMQEVRLEKARIFSERGEYAAAHEYLKEAIAALQKDNSSGTDLQLGHLYNGQGDIYRMQDLHAKALQSYQQALRYFSEDFNGNDLKDNPSPGPGSSPRDLLYTLTQKTRLLATTPPGLGNDWLNTAWSTARVGMDLIDSIKVNYTSDFDKQYLLEESYELYELALGIAYQLDEAAAAFEIMERSKAVALFAAVRDLHARTYAGVPKTATEKMRRIQYQLAKVDARLESAATEEQQIGLREERLQLKTAYSGMIRSFEQNYPAYYHLKYEQQVVRVPELFDEDLLQQEMLVEYFVGNRKAYACRIAKKGAKVQLIELPWDEKLKAWAVELKEDVHQRNDAAFREKALGLYQALLQPVLPETLPQSLLVIPDGILGYLPFDILLTEAVASGSEGNYRQYPFLMQQTAVSQNFSFTMLREMQFPQEERPEELLAFAPVFSGNDQLAERSDRNALGALLYNEAEAQAVSHWFKGKLVADRQATKREFLELAPHYRIYHIASHAVVDDESPNNSYIAFTDEAEGPVSDSRLYGYEILAQSFPADLVVLSACETGLGKVVRGEGLMS